MRAGMIPMRHCSGVTTPGQFGPTRRVAEPCSARFARAMSSVGIPSVMHTARRIPASAASRMASAAPEGGTKITDASAPVSATAWAAVSKTGIPSILDPPFPDQGETEEKQTLIPSPTLRVGDQESLEVRDGAGEIPAKKLGDPGIDTDVAGEPRRVLGIEHGHPVELGPRFIESQQREQRVSKGIGRVDVVRTGLDLLLKLAERLPARQPPGHEPAEATGRLHPFPSARSRTSFASAKTSPGIRTRSTSQSRGAVASTPIFAVVPSAAVGSRRFM